MILLRVKQLFDKFEFLFMFLMALIRNIFLFYHYMYNSCCWIILLSVFTELNKSTTHKSKIKLCKMLMIFMILVEISTLYDYKKNKKRDYGLVIFFYYHKNIF